MVNPHIESAYIAWQHQSIAALETWVNHGPGRRFDAAANRAYDAYDRLIAIARPAGESRQIARRCRQWESAMQRQLGIA